MFDSRALMSDPITREVELQLSKIYNPGASKSALRVEVVPVQQQEGVHDCGLFCIAFALELCLTGRPDTVHFDQHRMKKHLIHCLNKEHFEAFPKTKELETIPRPTRCFRKIKLYCICNMPETYDNRMILCDGCNSWFHCCCVLLSTKKIPDTWLCNACLYMILQILTARKHCRKRLVPLLRSALIGTRP